MVKFLRKDSHKYSKLGKRRKKKQIWRKPTGRDNKMREKIKGHPVSVSIGYKNKKDLEKDKIILIKNLKELEKIEKGKIGKLGKIGMKKKIEIVKKAKERKVNLGKINIEKFLKAHDKKIKVKENKKWI